MKTLDQLREEVSRDYRSKYYMDPPYLDNEVVSYLLHSQGVGFSNPSVKHRELALKQIEKDYPELKPSVGGWLKL